MKRLQVGPPFGPGGSASFRELLDDLAHTHGLLETIALVAFRYLCAVEALRNYRCMPLPQCCDGGGNAETCSVGGKVLSQHLWADSWRVAVD